MCYQMKAKRKQLNLSGSKELRERLENLAIKFKRRSGSTVALEIVEEYIDFWEVAENNRQATKQQQKAALMRDVASSPKLMGMSKEEVVGDLQDFFSSNTQDMSDPAVLEQPENQPSGRVDGSELPNTYMQDLEEQTKTGGKSKNKGKKSSR